MSFKVGQKVIVSKLLTDAYTNEKSYREMFFYNPNMNVDELTGESKEHYLKLTSQPADKTHIGIIKNIYYEDTGTEYEYLISVFKDETFNGIECFVGTKDIRPTSINLPEGMEEGVVIGKSV
jgi:hypothetical protein